MVVVGGLRARIIRDSTYNVIRDGLTALGWFTASPTHLPVTFIPEPLPIDIEVPLNTAGLSDDALDSGDLELGSNLAEHRWDFFVDFYGENDSISLHFIRDVADILSGRLPSINRGAPIIEVWNYAAATPSVVFNVEVEDVRTDKQHDFPQLWLRYWRSCSFSLVDTYADEVYQ